MKTKNFIIITALLLSTLIFAGCGFKINNTDGLQLAYEDIDSTSSYASELKAMKDVTKHISQGKFNAARDKFNTAKTKLNGYLQNAITNASDYKVDNPKEEYLKSEAPVAVAAFKEEVQSLRPRRNKGVPIATIIPIIIPIAEKAIDAIMKADQMAKDKGLEAFKTSVEKYMMKNLEEIPTGKLQEVVK
jgi:outer membrane murein-binding lipoprotein Lpp